MRKPLLALVALPLFVLACSSPPAAPAASDSPLNDPEVMEDELRGRPSYTVHSVAIRGEYRANDQEYCPGGFDACEQIKVHYESGKLRLEFGDYDAYYGYWQEGASAWSERGVVLFDTGELTGDCDDPGCGNMLRITGVIYPVKVGDAWVPRIKASYSAEFPYPEQEGDNEGIVKTTMRLNKRP
jgi:hypothetical protein